MKENTPDSLKARLWAQVSGPLLAVGTLAGIELLSRLAFTIPNPPAILLLVVVFSAFTGGLRPGLISAAIAWTYFAYFFSIPGQPFHYTDENLRRVMVWAVTTPTIVLMVGLLKGRAERAFEIARANAILAEQVAERQRSEEGLRESEARKGAILEAALDCIITIDHQGRITEFNPAAEKTFGYTRAEVMGREMAEVIIPPALRESHRRGLAHYLATGQGPVLGKRLEMPAVRADGTEFPVELAITRIRLEGPPMFTGYLRDITERKRAEATLQALYEELQQAALQLEARVEDRTRALQVANAQLQEATRRAEEASRYKSEFLANMSHELRTPLNAVIGFSALLEEGLHGPLTEKQRRYIGHIHTSGQHLLAIINDILDLSKVEAGKIVLEPQTLLVGEILEGTVTMVRPTAQKKHIALTLEMPADLPPLTADPVRLKQILFNLLSNAVKFTAEGGSVTARARQPEPDWLEIAVIDTGVGLAPEDLPKLFREFSQVSTGEGRQHEGTGLGLALTKRLVELHGGTVRAESPGRGRGSTFTVRLPIGGPTEPAAVEAPLSTEARPEPVVGPLVLVVEDEPEVARTFEACLADAGYRVLVARDGEGALHLAALHRPDVITLDLLLPGRDGWEVMTMLKQDPATRAIPVVVVSVVPKTKAGFAAGAVEYLEKPVNRAALLGAVSRYAVPKAGQAPPRVLVVDDDPMVREMLEESLARAGYAVRTAAEGETGLALAWREAPDLMVLDLLMPGLSGFEVLQRIREDRRTADLPVIVYTAASLTATNRQRLNAQVAALVQKGGPIDASLLREIARHAPLPGSRPA